MTEPRPALEVAANYWELSRLRSGPLEDYWGLFAFDAEGAHFVAS